MQQAVQDCILSGIDRATKDKNATARVLYYRDTKDIVEWNTITHPWRDVDVLNNYKWQKGKTSPKPTIGQLNHSDATGVIEEC